MRNNWMSIFHVLALRPFRTGSNYQWKETVRRLRCQRHEITTMSKRNGREGLRLNPWLGRHESRRGPLIRCRDVACDKTKAEQVVRSVGGVKNVVKTADRVID